jgi:cytochrome c-type biogenesis protein CcmH/NrfG
LTPPGSGTVVSIADRSPKRAATRRVVIYAALAIAILSLVGLLASKLAGAHATKMRSQRTLAAVRVRPDHVEAWGDLGTTAYLSGCYRDSVEAFDKAQRLRANYLDHRDVQRSAWEDARRSPDVATEDAPH